MIKKRSPESGDCLKMEIMVTGRILMLFVVIFSGCASTSLKNGTNAGVDTVCLTDCNDIPNAIEQFTKTHTLRTERDELDYLFYRIRTSRRKFIRNGMEVESTAAAQFLRWKLGWYKRVYHEAILTDEDFVSRILKGSEKTGRPYEIVMPDGHRYNAQGIMQNELNYLNHYNKQNLNRV